MAACASVFLLGSVLQFALWILEGLDAPEPGVILTLDVTALVAEKSL